MEVEFECDPSVDLGTLSALPTEGATYRFLMRTSLVCAPRGVECRVGDAAGNQYDLTPLARDTYWRAVNSGGDNSVYYINVCRPINNAPTSCPGEEWLPCTFLK